MENDISAFATLDHGREERQGFPEVIFSERKTPAEVASIARELFERSGRLLATRADRVQFDAVAKLLPQAKYHERARTISILPETSKIPKHLSSATVAVISAGTSDLPASEEACSTLEVAGIGSILRIVDVGVAGIHRLLERSEEFRRAHAIIVAAGMEGALPSVVGGLVKVPVIALPTSVGYGASFEGLAALLGMLNSCASGITVVNIDNGFGAAMAAIRILSSHDLR
jgi:pyridinium-3,5-biscarboxylic acid mononucleotide synthase